MRQPSRRRRPSRPGLGRGWAAASVALAFAALLTHSGPRGGAGIPPAVELVATGVSRPLQLAVDGGTLLVLSPGLDGATAGELHRVRLDGPLPADLSRQSRVRIPYADARVSTFGSLARDPTTRQLFFGEENGTRIYRLDGEDRLALYATGLHRLAGGSSLAFGPDGRLLVLDYVDRTLERADETVPPGLEPFREEDYRGPLVFRLTAAADIPLPRRLDRLAPFYPRAWGGPAGGALLPRFVSLAALPSGDVALLASSGECVRLAADGRLVSLARLPPGYGQYDRTNLAAGADGTLYVSGGFHVARVFRVQAGRVETLAHNLGDPEGIALDDRGWLYVAESALHRIVRVRVG